MCGFVALFGDKPLTDVQVNRVKEMSTLIGHRGPDQHGFFAEENVCFSFNRLSIVDYESGSQPMTYDDDNYVIVFNGEIYNYIELREMLIEKGVEFKTQSDTEVILALYKLEGNAVIDHLRGMFAFIIWDKQKGKIFGARDPYGIKPLFYKEEEGLVYFASELKSLVDKTENISNINEGALQQYLTFQYVPGAETLFEGYKVVEPGHTIEKKIGEKLNIERCFFVKFVPTQSPFEEKLKEIREAIIDSVNIRMRSDVSQGMFLSGGIDSTIIATIASKINPGFKVFTVGFDREGFSELDYSRQTAKALGLDNYEKIIRPDEFIEHLPRIVWHMDMPVADPAAVPLYFVAREASKHVRVVLSGEGADELFGGYNIYCEPDSLRIFKYVPDFLKGGLIKVAHKLPEGLKGKSFIERGCTPMEERYYGNATIFTQEEKKEIFKKYSSEIYPQLITKPLFDEAAQYDPVTAMQYVDIHTWLRGDILVKSDRMTMAHSIESRMPFLDIKVLEAASKLTRNEKVNKNVTKRALRDAFKDMIPKNALSRRKLGFPVPIRHWLKNELYSWAEDIIVRSQVDEYIHKDKVLEMLKQHKEGPLDYSRKLWTLLIFMLWHMIYIEKSITVEPPVKLDEADFKNIKDLADQALATH